MRRESKIHHDKKKGLLNTKEGIDGGKGGRNVLTIVIKTHKTKVLPNERSHPLLGP